MSGIIDTYLRRKVSFSGQIETAWGDPVDLVAIFSPDAADPGGGAIIEVCELYIAQSGAPGITANEHLGMRLMALHDETPGDVDPGTDHGDQSRRFIDANDLFDQAESSATLVADAAVTAASADTEELFEDGWNIQIPYKQVWLPDDRPSAVLDRAGTGNVAALLWRLMDLPSVDMDVRGHFVYRCVSPVPWD